VLNPWNLNKLHSIEKDSGRKIFNILQLRLHPSIIELKRSIDNGPANKVYDVDCLSFKILGTKTLKNLSKDSTKLPFYTRIKKIKKGIMNLDENMINYNNYYKSLLGL
jgi:hypothetical protein